MDLTPCDAMKYRDPRRSNKLRPSETVEKLTSSFQGETQKCGIQAGHWLGFNRSRHGSPMTTGSDVAMKLDDLESLDCYG